MSSVPPVHQQTNLILIESTDDSVESAHRTGLWDRHFQTLSALADSFTVRYYSSDRRPFQEAMPEGVTHRVPRPGTSIYGLRHLLYYMFLTVEAIRWRRSGHVIAVLGVNQPVLPLLRLLSGLNVVSFFHYNWASQTRANYPRYLPKSISSPLIQRLSLASSNCVMCASAQLLDYVRERYPDTPARLVPNYVDTSMFRPRPPRKKQIVFVGRLHWSKGVDTLIDAFFILSPKWPDLELLIIGGGEEMVMLKRRAAGHSRIEFAGPTPYGRVAEIVSSAQLFALPTRTMEGHPRAMVEAMAAGCQCVASDVPGNREVLLESGCPEYLFTPGDAEGLAERLTLALSRSGDERQYLYAISHYDKSTVMSAFAQTLKSYVGPARAGQVHTPQN